MNLHQYMTPAWAAERLLEGRQFSGTVADLCCGEAAFLSAIPKDVDAFGVEIDPAKAEIARINTGREVLVADVRTVILPRQPSAIVGNPPFKVKLIEAMMERAQDWLPTDGTMSLILPVHFFKSAARVIGYTGRWEISAELLPYGVLWTKLRYPLAWCHFRKGGSLLIGFSLFHEAADVQSMRMEYRRALQQPGLTWGEVVRLALKALGGEADLEEIYAVVAPHRPTDNPWWKAQIRKHAQRYRRVAPSRYALEAAA